MKIYRQLIIIAIILLITIIVIGANKAKNSPPSDSSNFTSNPFNLDPSPNINARQLCYIWNTEAGDKATLSMDIRGKQVMGEFNFLPAEKDKKTGIFKGTVTSLNSDPNKWGVDGLWDTKAEGTLNEEQLWIVFSNTIASPGFGEMKKRSDGVYIYADPEHISYDLNLQQTDCGDSAMD